MPYLVKTGVTCPQCDGELVKRVSRRKRVFYGCSNFPTCQFTTSYKPIPLPCPNCGKLLVLHGKDWANCIACEYKVKLSELEKKEREGAAL